MDFLSQDLNQRRLYLEEQLRRDVQIVTFKKTDGTERVMPCTLRADLIPELDQSKKSTRKRSEETLSVWATDVNDWRSFRIMNVTNIAAQHTPTTWIISLEEDPETGDLIMPLPPELLATQGWQIGDTLTWDVDESTQTITLKKNVE